MARGLVDIRQVATDVMPGQVWYWNSLAYRVYAVLATQVALTFVDIVDTREHRHLRFVDNDEFFDFYTSEPT